MNINARTAPGIVETLALGEMETLLWVFGDGCGFAARGNEWREATTNYETLCSLAERGIIERLGEPGAANEFFVIHPYIYRELVERNNTLNKSAAVAAASPYKPAFIRHNPKGESTVLPIWITNDVWRCPECGSAHVLNSYAVAQRAQGTNLVFKCQCGAKVKFN